MILFVWDCGPAVLANTADEACELVLAAYSLKLHCGSTRDIIKMCQWTLGASLDHDHGLSCYHFVQHTHTERCYWLASPESPAFRADELEQRPREFVTDVAVVLPRLDC